MKLRIVSLALCLGFLVSACAPAGPKSPTGRADFDAFVEALNQTRKDEPPWTEEEKAEVRGYVSDRAPLLTDEMLDRLMTDRETSLSHLTKMAELEEDIDLLFQVMKDSYGAYDYLGGDAIFLPLRDDIMNGLEEKSSWSRKRLRLYLQDKLGEVIQDGHFSLDGRGVLADQQVMYYVPGLFFDRAEASPDALVRPTIGPDGQLTWCFAALSLNGSDLPKSEKLSGEPIELEWIAAPPISTQRFPIYLREKSAGIPILVCRALAGEEKELDALAGSGEIWGREPLMLLDLRANIGGNSGYISGWIEGYAGRAVLEKRIHSGKQSRLSAKNYENSENDTSFGSWRVYESDRIVVASDRLLFVLQDGGTASAGENGIYGLHSLENVVFVGSNSAGCTMMGNIMDVYLPNSGLNVRFGANLAFYGTTENIEGRGHLPDLWVPPQEAEDAVLRLIRYYSLK